MKKNSKKFLNNGVLITLASAMMVASTAACQGKVANSSSSSAEDIPQTTSHSDPVIPSETTDSVEITSETYTEETTTREPYVVSPNTITENGEIVGTHQVQVETTTTIVTTTTAPVQAPAETTIQITTPQVIPENVVTETIQTSSDVSTIPNDEVINSETPDTSIQPSRRPPVSIPPVNISGTYTIQEGDTLWAIADMHGISVYELALANNMDINDIIIPGQQLIIPKNDAVLDEILRDTESSNSESDTNYYIVVSGDSFTAIASQFGITAEQLATANGKTLDDYIYPGDLLVIPSNTFESPSIIEQSNENSSVECIPETDVPDQNMCEEIPTETQSSDYSEESSESLADETPSNDDVSVSDESFSNDILNTIKNFETEYVGTNIGMGIYSLDGSPLFEYNIYSPISGACTIKAPYAMYVLRCCEDEGIDIWNTKLTYQAGMRNDGSGNIKYSAIGSEYTIAYLLTQLLSISDNTAYNILVSRFGLSGYQVFLNSIGGQQLYGLQYGTATVEQRRNEWIAIYNYINSGNYYSYTLQQMLSNTAYCYLVEGMANYHNYLHKSGWSYGSGYTSASDCAIVDNRYLVIVLSQDYNTGIAHTDIVNVLGREAEIFMG